MTIPQEQILRRVRFAPYTKGCGPRFALTIWSTNRTDWRGQTCLGYRLTMTKGKKRMTLFTGTDFAGSPLHADDSDATIAAIMGFLTVCPGDAEADYFKDYTPMQLDYCAQHAEVLSGEVEYRFGERN